MGMKKKVAMVAVKALLRQGNYPAQIAKKLGVSHTAILNKIRELRLKGQIVRLKTYPATYRVLTLEEAVATNSIMGSSKRNLEGHTSDNPNRPLEPHNFGEWYALKSGDLSLARGFKKEHKVSGMVVRQWRFPDVLLIAYLGKAPKVVVWVKSFKGVLPLQQVAWGRAQIRERIAVFSAENGLELEFLKYAGKGAIEWATTEIKAGLGEAVKTSLGLRSGEKTTIGDMVVKSSDASHPGKVEFVPLDPDKRPFSATIQGQRFAVMVQDDKIVELPKRFIVLEKQVSEVVSSFLKISKALSAVTEKEADKPIVPIEDKDRKEVA